GGHSGLRWVVVRTLGSELHLRHLAGAAWPAGNQRRYDSGLGFARTRLARELPKQRWRLGRDLWHLRKSIDQRDWPKHRVANCLGDHGHLRLRRLGAAERSTWLASPS